ncbi:MAG: 2-amino-4-hydroxy-6-hydroxymethyldihydropteridine diphosphokinase, partial [Planctomycetota bacterium]|nr:2-amino-4-hydroxy-6-hydroxymethyldihydropteridine diphosphokinase [Planctomycetota bacterium]
MTVVYLSLGSNLGGRRQYISNAVACLGESPWLSELKLSSIIETAAVGGPVQGDFLNAVLQCKCSCSAHELLGLVNDVEHLLGRQRAGKNHPRTIDIDILLFGEEQHQHP